MKNDLIESGLKNVKNGIKWLENELKIALLNGSEVEIKALEDKIKFVKAQYEYAKFMSRPIPSSGLTKQGKVKQVYVNQIKEARAKYENVIHNSFVN